MGVSNAQLMAKVAEQRTLIPALYGQVDFSITPERYTEDEHVRSALQGPRRRRRNALLANRELVGRIRAYTMLGDNVADAYAALMPEYGFRRLVAMLAEACERGVDTVAGAPPELVAFIRDMERIPAWLDMRLVEEGARAQRNAAAHLGPYILRGAFIATFMNKYAALPMALTGTLSNQTAARRVHETATFFTTTVMPGALRRHGAGFKAAAMVRLMHSMVRFNALRKGSRWDVATYGIPIPQVDQMPAGLIDTYLLAEKVLGEGRTVFTRAERARVELARYRCFLLGLPEDLLPATPQELVDVLATRSATLRAAYDDATCGELLRATMAADLAPAQTLREKLSVRMERGISKLFFVRNFMAGDKTRAAKLGVVVTRGDLVAAAAAGALISGRMRAYRLAARVPGLDAVADRCLVGKLTRLLASYGHAEFTSDAESYRPKHIKPEGTQA
ncbi:oxygenase MpaB family protein [Chelatococcus reniformis]|uniref:DUF2236 domain-containing protein n=1 Tax=Chelatococcus reniformis TaxID=1494448 RepID=A0A916TXW8_9HYPH|nr:oxygenase MpaB family protein [Chelatococcus reniformis]GGC49130.1 hypothetical protein GCM10010994_05330 [Chelatococcus reniformis]